MKSKKIRILILMIVQVAIGTIGYFLFASEKDDVLVRRRFSELSETVRKTGNEGLLVSLEKAKTASRFFDDYCTLKLEQIPQGVGVMSRENVASNTALLRKYFRSMHISFYDMEIRLDPGGDKASASFTAVFKGNGQGGRIEEPREMDAGLVKKDGLWLIQTLAFRDVIQK